MINFQVYSQVVVISGVQWEGAAGTVPADSHVPSCQRDSGCGRDCRAPSPQPKAEQSQFSFPQLCQAPEGKGMDTQLIPHWLLIYTALGKAPSHGNKSPRFTASSMEHSEISIVKHKIFEMFSLGSFLFSSDTSIKCDTKSEQPVMPCES